MAAPMTPFNDPLEDPDELLDSGVESGDEEVLDELAAASNLDIEPDSDVILDTMSMPDEVTGRATATSEDLTALFGHDDAEHIADGFAGSGDEDGDSISQNDADDLPDLPARPDGA